MLRDGVLRDGLEGERAGVRRPHYRNTYDPGSWVKIEGDAKTDLYIAFRADQIRPVDANLEPSEGS